MLIGELVGESKADITAIENLLTFGLKIVCGEDLVENPLDGSRLPDNKLIEASRTECCHTCEEIIMVASQLYRGILSCLTSCSLGNSVLDVKRRDYRDREAPGRVVILTGPLAMTSTSHKLEPGILLSD